MTSPAAQPRRRQGPVHAAPRGARRGSARPRGAARAATRWSTTLRLSLVLLVLVFIGRVHEAIPGVGAIPIANVVVILAAASLAMNGYLRRLPLVLRAPPVRLALGLLLLAALSVPFALWPGGAADSLATSGKLWVLCILIPLAISNSPQLTFVTRTFVVAAAILVTGQIVESAFGLTGFAERQNLGFDRNDVALFAVMAIPFAVLWGTTGRSRLLGFGMAGYLVAGTIATGSRGGFLALLAVGAVFLLKSRVISTPKKIAFLVAAIGFASLAGSGEYWERVTSIFSRPTEDYNFQSREGRIEIWKRGLGYAAANPVTGVGFGNFPIAEGRTLEDLGYGVKWSTAHSAYVLVLAELGFPGLVLFLAALFTIYRETRRSMRGPTARGPPGVRDLDLVGVAEATRGSFVGFVTGAAFLSVTYSVAFLFLVAMGASLHLLRRQIGVRRAVAAPRGAAVLRA